MISSGSARSTAAKRGQAFRFFCNGVPRGLSRFEQCEYYIPQDGRNCQRKMLPPVAWCDGLTRGIQSREMSNREKMLEKIRRALGRNPDNALGAAMAPPPLEDEGAAPATAGEALLLEFEREFEAVGGKTYRARSAAELSEVLRSILEGCGARRVVLSGNPMLAEAGVAEKCLRLGKAVVGWNGGPDEAGFRVEGFAADAGITGVSFALAESGSLVLTSAREGSQLASLAPPIHIALYTRQQICARLEEVLRGLSREAEGGPGGKGRSVVFVTGTSRTADIEQILIRGVHGPREEHAVLLEPACLGDE